MRTLHVVSHTHWDREWYLTFQQFRMKLVRLVDGLLDILDDQSGFLLGVRRSVERARETVLFFETPNADATLTRLTPWNVVYEHCSWFTAETLALFFELHGFDVLAAGPCNNDEYLYLEARPAGQVLLRHLPDPAAVAAREAELTGVAERFAGAVRRWRELLAREREAGRSIALWGAGARAIGFLSAPTASPPAFCCSAAALTPILRKRIPSVIPWLPVTAKFSSLVCP